MEVVIDTNVLMSGMIWSGVPGRVLEAWALKKFEAAASLDIISEYTRVAKLLAKKAPKMELEIQVEKFIMSCKMYHPAPLKEQISIDPFDDMFIACALSTELKIIVSGDSDLLEIPKDCGVSVFKPREFIEKYF